MEVSAADTTVHFRYRFQSNPDYELKIVELNASKDKYEFGTFVIQLLHDGLLSDWYTVPADSSQKGEISIYRYHTLYKTHVRPPIPGVDELIELEEVNVGEIWDGYYLRRILLGKQNGRLIRPLMIANDAFGVSLDHPLISFKHAQDFCIPESNEHGKRISVYSRAVESSQYWKRKTDKYAYRTFFVDETEYVLQGLEFIPDRKTSCDRLRIRSRTGVKLRVMPTTETMSYYQLMTDTALYGERLRIIRRTNVYSCPESGNCDYWFLVEKDGKHYYVFGAYAEPCPSDNPDNP